MNSRAAMASEDGAEPQGPRATRPRNRRALIVAAAVELFHSRGYDHVSMGNIADAVGIVPSALYRHFPSKQELMREVVLSGIAPAREALLDLDPEHRDLVVASLVTLCIERPEIGVIWRREARHLDEQNRLPLRAEIQTIEGQLAKLVLAGRPNLSPGVADLLGWSMFGVLLSSSPTPVATDKPANAKLLMQLCNVVLDADVPDGPPVRKATQNTDRLAPVSRREKLLAGAVHLFAEHGYARVSIEDIGASVGIAGPSVYNHFSGKAEILSAAVVRTCEHIRMRLAEAYAQGVDATDVLQRLVSSYVDFSNTNPDLVTLLLTEENHLPDEVATTVRRTLRDFVDEAAHLMAITHPQMRSDEVRQRIYATLSMSNDIARTPSLHRSLDVVPAVEALAWRLLGLSAD